MRSKKTLLVSSLILAISAIALSSAVVFAAKPQRIAMIATYRDAPGDGALGDGAPYVDGDPGVQAYISGGSFSLFAGSGRTLAYNLSTPVDPDSGGACAAGTTPSVSGPGNIRVTPYNAGGFTQIPIGVSQAGLATTNLTGGIPADDYLLRFRPDDPLDSSANCSVDATITRIDADTWEVEVFAGADVARLLTNRPKGPGWINLGHYSAPFKITLRKK